MNPSLRQRSFALGKRRLEYSSFSGQVPRVRFFIRAVGSASGGQVFSPPIVIAHDSKFSLFTLGEAASPELGALAEDGLTGPLDVLIDGWYPSAVAGGPIMPGDSVSVTLEISKVSHSTLISVAGMLVIPNDAFFAVRDIWFLGRGKTIV